MANNNLIKKNSNQRGNNTLEILRTLEENNRLNGEKFNPQEKLSFFRERPWQIKPQENLIFSQKEEQVKRQIQLILEELDKLAKATQSLTKEIKTAITQPPVKPGVYHVSFLEKIKETLMLLRQKTEQSASWMTAFNSRNKKQGTYWGNFKKSGQKYLLSQERYSATQVG